MSHDIYQKQNAWRNDMLGISGHWEWLYVNYSIKEKNEGSFITLISGAQHSTS